jgi:hypothetical protein
VTSYELTPEQRWRVDHKVLSLVVSDVSLEARATASLWIARDHYFCASWVLPFDLLGEGMFGEWDQAFRESEDPWTIALAIDELARSAEAAQGWVSDEKW